MVRYALALLALLFAAAYWLAREAPPEPKAAIGEAELFGVRFRLYPEADPKAEWIFAAGQVDYDPGRRESRVIGLSRGERWVGGELDLKLTAQEVRIDRYDNLLMPEAEVEIPKECWRIELSGTGGQPVRIDQRRGFYAPKFRLEGPGVRVEGEGFRADFGLEEASWRSGREEWRTGEENACKR